MDLDGKPIGKASDIPMAGQLGGVMGVGIAANGDVWIADGTKNHMLYFPGGRVSDGRIVEVPGLKSPFGVAIDAQNRVWVSNAQSDTVVRFPADDPAKAEVVPGGNQRPRHRARFQRQPLGREQHVAGFPAAGDPRRRVDHEAVPDRSRAHARDFWPRTRK